MVYPYNYSLFFHDQNVNKKVCDEIIKKRDEFLINIYIQKQHVI